MKNLVQVFATIIAISSFSLSVSAGPLNKIVNKVKIETHCSKPMQLILGIQKPINADLANAIESELVFNRSFELKRFLKLDHYSDEEIKLIFDTLDKIPEKKIEKHTLKAYLSFISTLSVSKKIEAILELENLNQESSRSKILQAFDKSQKKIASIAEDFYDDSFYYRKIKNPELTASEWGYLAKADAQKYKVRYEELYYQCRARVETPAHKAAQASYKKFTTAVGLSSTMFFFYKANADKDTNEEWYGHNGDWYKRLALEVVYSLFSNWVSNQFTLRPEDTQLMKSVKNWLINRGASAFDIAVYGLLFSPNDEKVKEKLNKVLASPDFQENINKMTKNFGNQYFYQKYIRNPILEGINKMGGSLDLSGIHGLPQGIDWKHLTKKDLDNPKVQDILMKVAYADFYEESKGKGNLQFDIASEHIGPFDLTIQTGQSSLDRFTFNSDFGLLMIPPGMLKQYMIYHTLCMGQDNPGVASLKALGIYAAHKAASDAVYFPSRLESIGQ